MNKISTSNKRQSDEGVAALAIRHNELHFRKSLGRKQIANARLRDRKDDLGNRLSDSSSTGVLSIYSFRIVFEPRNCVQQLLCFISL